MYSSGSSSRTRSYMGSSSSGSRRTARNDDAPRPISNDRSSRNRSPTRTSKVYPPDDIMNVIQSSNDRLVADVSRVVTELLEGQGQLLDAIMESLDQINKRLDTLEGDMKKIDPKSLWNWKNSAGTNGDESELVNLMSE